MAEWFKAHAWKVCKGAILSWVRIPFSPPILKFMIKENISRSSFFYKLYLYFRIYWLNKAFIKRKRYSQCGEDVFIDNFFRAKKKGTYVDIGAFNPIKYNNTLLLYQRNWRGINIDLNQTSIDMFNILRPEDKNICAIINISNIKTKVYIENLFSPLNTISKKFSKNLSKKKIYSKKNKKFNDLIKHQFDFLNIDIEGMDFKVLKSINLRFYQPKLICIEIFGNKNFLKVKKYLKQRKYVFTKKIGPSYFFRQFKKNGK